MVIYSLKIFKGKLIKKINSHEGPITCLSLNKKFFITGSQDKSIKIFNYEGNLIKEYFDHEKSVNDVKILYDKDEYFASCSDDGCINIYKNFTLKFKLKGIINI
jgi:WD40 repeat protein